MLCDRKCGTCIDEDRASGTVRIDLAQLLGACDVSAEVITCKSPTAGMGGFKEEPVARPIEEPINDLITCKEQLRKHHVEVVDEVPEPEAADLNLPYRQLCVSTFLRKHGFAAVNIPKRSWMQRTYALHKAAELADETMIEMLLAEGADWSLRNSAGRTAADVAKKRDKCGSHATVFNMLVDAQRQLSPKAGGM
mmetsp:Transcript_24605/g.46452  ORF Transcript_24605/g.46452 Transcript_24605/m.46452 type:complete len:194 (+) Transcript_24605:47-628(+)